MNLFNTDYDIMENNLGNVSAENCDNPMIAGEIMREQLLTPAGRAIKFTPERIEQIKTLVERGLSRQQIAETIGSTLGSLQVTCSRMGISLRRLRVHDGVKIQKPTIHTIRGTRMNTNGENDDVIFSLQLEFRGQQRNITLPLSKDAFGRLALMAAVRNCNLSDLLIEIINAAVFENSAKQ